MLCQIILGVILCVGVLYHLLTVVVIAAMFALAMRVATGAQGKYQAPWSEATDMFLIGMSIAIILAWYLVLLWAVNRRTRDREHRVARELHTFADFFTLAFPVVGIRPFVKAVSCAWREGQTWGEAWKRQDGQKPLNGADSRK